MWILLWFVASSFIYSAEGRCSGGARECQWISWKSWSSCSESCGGGRRYRSRPACCDADSSFDQCMKDCNMDSSDASESGSCNEICYHGNFHHDNSLSFSYGHCICKPEYGGDCCDIGKLRCSYFILFVVKVLF